LGFVSTSHFVAETMVVLWNPHTFHWIFHTSAHSFLCFDHVTSAATVFFIHSKFPRTKVELEWVVGT
jgi:hypothetical protein